MSKAFISYSTEDAIVSKLSQLLQQQGFSVQSSYNPRSSILDFTAYTAMQKSDVFIGVITTEGQWERVWHEFQVAKSLNIPALLLAEDVFQNITPEKNVVRFNKRNPNAAIQQVEAIMKPSQDDSSNPLVWIAGGIALLGLLKLFSDDEPKPKPKLKTKSKGGGTKSAATS